jgi:hypothetical protein
VVDLVPEEHFLLATYRMNGCSFAGLEQYENMPTSKWRKLLEAHNQHVLEHNALVESAGK